MSSATNKELGAAPDNAGDTMEFYNAVDPTAAVGSIGYFTWTVSDSAGNKTQRGKQLSDLAFALRKIENLKGDVAKNEANVTLMGRQYPKIKEEIFDITQKMNRGGLASRRT